MNRYRRLKTVPDQIDLGLRKKDRHEKKQESAHKRAFLRES